MNVFRTLQRLKEVRIMPVARVVTYFMFVGGAIAGVAMHEAKADMTEQGFVLGRELHHVADLLDHTYELNINGQTAYIARNETTLSMNEILDRYETVCKENPGIVAEAWKSLPQGAQRLTGDKDHPGLVGQFGIVRKDGAHEGMVACLAKSDRAIGSAQEGLDRFTKTGELSYIGKLRYAYVTGPSMSGRYEVTTIWTENNFNVNSIMVPDTGDAPGTDSPTVGRPAESRRLFAANITGAPYGLRMYESTATRENVYARYDSTLTSQDWQVLSIGDDAHVYVKGGVETIVQAIPDKGKTFVTVSELGGDQLRSAK